MSLFRKHHTKEEIVYNYPIPAIKERILEFRMIDSLTRQAEFYVDNKQPELSEGIFELMIKYIEKHKSIRVLTFEDLEFNKEKDVL